MVMLGLSVRVGGLEAHGPSETPRNSMGPQRGLMRPPSAIDCVIANTTPANGGLLAALQCDMRLLKPCVIACTARYTEGQWPDECSESATNR